MSESLEVDPQIVPGDSGENGEGYAIPREPIGGSITRQGGFILLLLMLLALWPGAVMTMEAFAAAPPPARHCVDANVAPWWELALLPRLGVATARNVAAYRDEWRVRNEMSRGPAEGVAGVGEEDPGRQDRAIFRSAADLTKVRGIGPQTVQRIRSHLCASDGRRAGG